MSLVCADAARVSLVRTDPAGAFADAAYVALACINPAHVTHVMVTGLIIVFILLSCRSGKRGAEDVEE